MGKYNSSANNIYQELTGVLGAGVFSMPAYFNNTVYYTAMGDAIKAFKIASAKLSTSPSFQSGNTFPYPGATPSISANGSSNGILWAAENGGTAVLHAYDASNLHELYNSNQASGARISSEPATNSLLRPSRMAKCTWEPPTAWAYLACCPDDLEFRS